MYIAREKLIWNLVARYYAKSTGFGYGKRTLPLRKNT